MLDLSLIDAIAILFIGFKISRAHSVSLGDSLHGLIAILLILSLLMGLQLASQLKGVLTGMAEFLQTIPGLGTKLLIAVGTWYLMRFIRTKLGYWLESVIPNESHKPITYSSETLRAAFLVVLVVWLFKGWFPENPNESPAIVNLIRSGDTWIAENLKPEETKAPPTYTHPYQHPMYPPLPYQQPTPPPPPPGPQQR